MAIGKKVLKEYRYDGCDDAVLTVLEGNELMIEVSPLSCFSAVDILRLTSWLDARIAEVLEGDVRG